MLDCSVWNYAKRDHLDVQVFDTDSQSERVSVTVRRINGVVEITVLTPDSESHYILGQESETHKV